MVLLGLIVYLMLIDILFAKKNYIFLKHYYLHGDNSVLNLLP